MPNIIPHSLFFVCQIRSQPAEQLDSCDDRKPPQTRPHTRGHGLRHDIEAKQATKRQKGFTFCLLASDHFDEPSYPRTLRGFRSLSWPARKPVFTFIDLYLLVAETNKLALFCQTVRKIDKELKRRRYCGWALIA